MKDLNHKKIGGILIESNTIKNKLGIVIGIGININENENDIPLEIQEKTSSLFIYSGKEFKREIIISSILNEFESLYFHDWQNITSLWEKYCIHKNNTITFHNGEEFLQGEFQGITNSGYAQIKLNGEIETLPAGMITL